jgi:hypothetical protein
LQFRPDITNFHLDLALPRDAGGAVRVNRTCAAALACIGSASKFARADIAHIPPPAVRTTTDFPGRLMGKLSRTMELNLLLTLCAMGAAGAAHAGDGSRREGAEKLRQKFVAADVNHDGLLDRAEAHGGMPRVAKHFDDIDSDHDGKLSQAEIAAWVTKMRAARK